MAVAGGAGPGIWMKLVDGKLVRGKPCTTTVQVRDLHEAVTAILAGYHVHVDNYRALDQAVVREVEKEVERRLGEGASLSPSPTQSPTQSPTYIPGITKLGEDNGNG